MASYPARERRHTIWLGARMLSRGGWSDLTIGNVSSRGLMGMCRNPPEPGECIEVRCGTYVIIARIAWRDAGRFGATTFNRIELTDLLSGSIGRQYSGERRKLPRPQRDEKRSEPVAAQLAGTTGADRSLMRTAIIGLTVLSAMVCLAWVREVAAGPVAQAPGFARIPDG